MTDADLAACRARNEWRRQLKDQATPGPWVECATCVYGAPSPGGGVRCLFKDVTGTTADATFISAARNDPVEADVDSLLAEVARLKTWIDPFRATAHHAIEQSQQLATENDSLRAGLREIAALGGINDELAPILKRLGIS